MKELECSQHFSHCKSTGKVFRRSKAANSAVHSPIRLNLELSPDFMVVLVTCKISENDMIGQGKIEMLAKCFTIIANLFYKWYICLGMLANACECC